MLWFTLSALAVELDEPHRTGAVAPHDAAVVIGAEGYAFVPPVPYARRDAQRWHDTLVHTVGVPDDRVQLLLDPSREQMLAALATAREQVGEGGTLWVSFAGHGVASADAGERLLLGVDVMADPAHFDARGLTLDELAPELPGVRTVALLDACYSGLGRSGEPVAPGARLAAPSWALTPSAGRVVWSAASPGQLAGPLPGAGHGAFTYLATGALRGWADGQLDGVRDGKVTLAEAQQWVQRALVDGPNAQQPELLAADPELVVSHGTETAVALPPQWWAMPPTPQEVRPDVGRPSGCPWSEVDSVVAQMKVVTVNGEDWPVVGQVARDAFRQQLQACGFSAADDRFRAWRATRRTTNATLYPFLGLGGIAPALAGSRRKEFEWALEAER